MATLFSIHISVARALPIIITTLLFSPLVAVAAFVIILASVRSFVVAMIAAVVSAVK